MDLGTAYYHTNVTIVVQGYEPAETEGGTPRKVVDKAIGGITIDTRGPRFTPTANGRGIILEWQKVTNAAKYVIYRAKELGDETTETIYTTIGETAETTYTDSNFSDRYCTTQRYYYRIQPLEADGTELFHSAWIPAYCRLDFLNADSVHFSPRFPWSGQLDFRIQNFSARDKRFDGLPRFKLTATHEGNPIPVRTATLGDGTPIDPSDFTLVEDSPTNTMEWARLVWDARADLGETNITSALDFKIEYIGLTTTDGKPYVGDTVIEKSGPAEGLDTRLVPEVALDGRTTSVYADTGWWNPAAGYVLVYVEGTQKLSTSGTGSRALTTDILPIWGTNTLTITTDRGESWTGRVKYPDFAFTVSEGHTDGVKLTWNSVPGVADYAVRRRPLGSDAAFETVETVTGATTWTDATANEVGAFEYTVMPLLPSGADAGPAPAAQRGYRTLEEVELVAARSDEPWTPRVAIDIAYTSGRVAATDGAVTYRLERTDGGPLTALTNDVGVAIDPANVSLASGVTNRIWWFAEADLGAAAVVSDLALRLVPTLAADAPEGAVAAPAVLTCEPFAVDFRPTRNVNVGDTVSVSWLWTRTDARNEADDTICVEADTWVGTKTLLDSPVGAEARAGTLSFAVTLEYWTEFTLVKHEKNGDTDMATTSFVTYRLPTAAPQGLTATQGETNAVTLAWSAVPFASGYHIIANYTDCSREPAVTSTRDWHTSGDAATNTVDAAAPALGYAHYTVTAFYGNGATGPESTALGWRALDALELENVQTRKPWPSGRVDIDLAYTTARVTLRNRMGVSTPVPAITIAVQTAEGDVIPVSSLVREPPVSEYTEHLDRRILTNGQLFSADDDSGSWRIVWDTASWDSPVPKRVAPNAVLTVSIGDVVADTATFNLDTRRITRIPITADMETLPLRWATRWLEESPAMSLDLRRARNVRIVEIKDGVSSNLADEDLRDMEGVFYWTPPTDVANEVTVRATYEGMEKNDFTLTFFQAPVVNATAQYKADANAFHVTWDAVVDYDFDEVRYALLRRVVNRDGTAGDWTTVADSLVATSYDDDSVASDDTAVYEYAVRVRYSDGAGGWLDAAPSAGASAWAKTASLALSEPLLGAPWTATVGIDVEYVTGQLIGGASDLVEVFARDTVGNTNLTVRTLTLDGADVVNGSFTLDKGTTTSTGRIVWNAGADVPEASLAHVVLGVKTAGSSLEKETVPFTLDVRTVRDVSVGETVDIPWAWTRTDARDESADTLVLTANLNGDWDWTNLCEVAVGAGPRAGVATVTVTDDLWTSFRLEKHEMNGNTDEMTTSFVTYRLPAEVPQNMSASRDVTNAVTVMWSAVPQAAGYKVVAEDCDAEGNRRPPRLLTVSDGATTNIVDTAALMPGYTRYTVSALYPNDAVGQASAAAIGWRSLDALTATVKTRTPWPSGKVDIDLSYVTARHALRAETSEDVATSLPLTLVVRKADGAALTVATLTREPTVVESTFTLNRDAFTNGQALFSDTGATRIVWNAGADAAGVEAAGADLSVSLGDRVVAETTFDLDATKTKVVPLATDASGTRTLRWASRWANEGATSLNMMDGHDVRLVEETADGTRDLFNEHKRDEEGSVDWTPPADAYGLITVKALYDGAASDDYTLTFVRAPEVSLSASRNTGDGTIALSWVAAPGAAHYRVLRRAVNRDGTAGDWTTLAEQVTATTYDDTVDADDTTVYEYTILVCYANIADPDAPLASAPSTAATGWSSTAQLTLDGLTVSDPWETTVGVGVNFTYVTGQAFGASDFAEVVVTDEDGNTNLTVRTLALDGVAVANTAFTLDKGAVTSTGRLVWNAGADVPCVYLTNVVLRVKTASGLVKMVGPFTLDTYGTHAVFDALGPWLDGGATTVTQNVAAVYGAVPTATRAGYRLVGWFDGISGTARQVVEGMAPLTRDDHRLYAKWAVDPSASPVVDADGNSIFRWEATSPTTARILGFREANQRMTNMIIPDAIDGLVVTEIAAGAFANSASGLESLTLPVYCSTVGTRAFSGIKTLTRLAITPVRDAADPARMGTLSIGNYAFTATGLTEVFLPVEVGQIGNFAFADCRQLQNVTLLGRPTVGERPFRRAGIDAGVKPTIHLHPDLASDADYLAGLTQELGSGDVVVRTDAVVTGLSLGTFALPTPGTVRLTVGVERASTWGAVDASRLRVVYQAQIGDAPTDLVPNRILQEADGSLTLEVTAPDGPSGFFRVKLLK